MPRFGKQFKVYDRILPSQLLDVTDVIENSPRQCIICGKLATLECLECNGEHGGGGLLDREDEFIIDCWQFVAWRKSKKTDFGEEMS